MIQEGIDMVDLKFYQVSQDGIDHFGLEGDSKM